MKRQQALVFAVSFLACDRLGINSPMTPPPVILQGALSEVELKKIDLALSLANEAKRATTELASRTRATKIPIAEPEAPPEIPPEPARVVPSRLMSLATKANGRRVRAGEGILECPITRLRERARAAAAAGLRK